MPRLGDLERAVMRVLWDADGPRTAKAVCDAVDGGALAVTTILTVLTRLESKGMVTRAKEGRAHVYRAAASHADHVAELMREALGDAGDRDAALSRFVRGATPAEADVLRRALRALGRGGT